MHRREWKVDGFCGLPRCHLNAKRSGGTVWGANERIHSRWRERVGVGADDGGIALAGAHSLNGGDGARRIAKRSHQ